MVADTGRNTEHPGHRHVDADAYERITVVGDVHGCLSPLRALLAELSPGPTDLVVFVGDLVRKGPESEAVVEFVRDHPNCTSVRGNNEQKLLDGSAECGLSAAALSYLESLPAILTVGEELAVVHGGVRPDRDITAQDPTEVLTLRSLDGGGYEPPFWFEEYAGPPRVCFGHTVLDAPIDREWATGLDTGCVYGGDLTAYDVHEDVFRSVPGVPHRSRSDDSILSPEEPADAVVRTATPGA